MRGTDDDGLHTSVQRERNNGNEVEKLAEGHAFILQNILYYGD